MIFFITFLRALAACLITNAHYTGVYPTDLIANGGLLGDVIFFAVSGYCLYNVRQNFPRWYEKRLVRCYLPVLLITAFYFLIGSYSITENFSAVYWFLYPTHYHFVASIVVLYVPYYLVLKLDFLKKRIGWVMGAVALAYVLVYLFFYDKSYYHIDTVREPMIRFLFFESMLLGAWFKQNDGKFRNKRSILATVGAVLSIGVYFACKMVFTKMQSISSLQIVCQFVLFAFLFLIFRSMSGFDGALERMPKFLKAIVKFVADITLEIYLVQYVLIDALKSIAPFPINWIALTAAIILAALALHYATKGVLWGFGALFKRKKV